MATLLEVIKSIKDPAFAPMLEKRKCLEIAEYLNARAISTIDNPEPHGQVLPEFQVSDVFYVLTRSERGFFSNAPSLNEYLQTAYADEAIDENLINPLALGFVDQATGSLPLLAAAKNIVATQDREALGALAQLMVARGDLSTDSMTAITTMLSTTIPDPAWTPTVEVIEPSILEAAGLPPVTPIEVQMALVLPESVEA